MLKLNGKKLAAVIVAGISAAATVAQAALPAAAETAMTAVQTDGLLMVDEVWPVVGAITTAFILIKLFKRGASKV